MVTRALLEGLFGGRRYPASPEELADEARAAGVDGAVLAALARLRRPSYRSANEVTEELFPVEPDRDRVPSPEPRPESGPPPGGDRYTAA